MRVLWIAQNGGKYKNYKVKGTGGWIGALQEEIIKYKSDLELGIVFPNANDDAPVVDGKTTYLPYKMSSRKNKLQRILYYALRKWEKEDEICSTKILNAIELFKPDIIHIWGIEFPHIAVIPYIQCPHVVHIQGITSLCTYAYLPPFFSEDDLKKCNSFFERVILRHGEYNTYLEYHRRSKREILYSKFVKNWIGRTDFDYEASRLLSIDSNYYHGDEVMRNDFAGKKWEYHYQETLKIQSNISVDWYKGLDVILKTAKILAEKNIPFEWNIYGVSRGSKITTCISHKCNIKPEDVNVRFHGRVDGTTIFNSLLDSDVYVHPSYMENSSNAIAEAMYIGLPVIAQYVGGNPTMLKEESGILVAPNEPYSIAYHLLKLRDKEYAEGYSKRAISLAAKRQDNKKTVSDLLETYNSIINNKNN